MTLLPKHPITRVVAILWLSVCLAVLALALLQNSLYAEERSALAMLVPVYFLGFPCGHIALLAVNKIKLALYLSAGFSPSVLSECVFLWTFTIVLGYVQWFIVLPALSRKCWRLSRALFNPHSARTPD
ncbi:MAG: hypothetical protein ABL891_19050 [Burkholderiales bacterium]